MLFDSFFRGSATQKLTSGENLSAVPKGAEMKLEELTQEQLDMIVSKNEALESSVNGLKSDLVKLKARAKGSEIDPDEYANLQSQVETLSYKYDSDTKLSKKEIERLSNLVKEKDGALTTYLLDAGLTDALAKQKVKPELMDAAKAFLKQSAAIKSDNGNYQAVIGDKALHEYISEWVSSENGKHFVQPDANSGGGANGGQSSSQSKVITRAEFEAKSQYERASLAKEGFKVTD